MAGKLRFITPALPAITISTGYSPYSAQPSASHGSALYAPKNSGLGASSLTSQRPSSVTPHTTTPVASA